MLCAGGPVNSPKTFFVQYRSTDKSLPRPGRKQANVSVRMAGIFFSALPCKKKKTWWQLASRCCWNRTRPWRASELVSFLVGLSTYQHSGISTLPLYYHITYEVIIELILTRCQEWYRGKSTIPTSCSRKGSAESMPRIMTRNTEG